METTEDRCPCCHNHCRRDKLHCSRGRKYFEEQGRKEAQDDNSGLLLYTLMESGHALRHMVKHGRRPDEKEILSDLSQEEQEMLLSLLSRLNIERKGKRHRH